MANSIELAQKFLPVIDDIYKAGSVTAVLDAKTKNVDFSGVNTVSVLKVSTTGLGDYSRSEGYPKGDVTAKWEPMTLTEERGKEFSIDRMDDEETLGLAFGTVTGSFMRDHVIPELDAYRFAKYASKEGILKESGTAALTKDDIIAEIDEAVKGMDAAEVPREGRMLFVNSDLQPALNGALNRTWGSDSSANTILSSYNGMEIKYVVPSRFYTAITCNSGAESWGYAKAESGKNLNFMIVHPSALLQVQKFALPKIFTPDENQTMDAWKFQFRLYHDAFVYDNKVKGIFAHISNA
ncbi:MAG: hypothetical protein IJC78_02005 [Clostridia bacterium]|nr:hypothetical protein [Clostridia bacterium]